MKTVIACRLIVLFRLDEACEQKAEQEYGLQCLSDYSCLFPRYIHAQRNLCHRHIRVGRWAHRVNSAKTHIRSAKAGVPVFTAV